MPTDTDREMSRLERLMWEVYDHVKDNGARIYGGGASVAEADYLQRLTQTSGALAIAEIGFNIGFSSIAFLEAAPDTTVVSFELDRRHAVVMAKEFVDARYPGRHELVIGDSRTTEESSEALTIAARSMRVQGPPGGEAFRAHTHLLDFTKYQVGRNP